MAQFFRDVFHCIKTDKVQRATLLHLAGPAVQSILDIFAGDETTVKHVKDRLHELFAPKGNKWAKRYRFKCRIRQSQVSTDRFVSELRKLGTTCSFADIEDQIISQIIENCHNPKIREKLLTEGDGLTLEKEMTIARTFEQTQERAAMMISKTSIISGIIPKHLKKLPVSKPNSEKTSSDNKCFACGNAEHFRGAVECRAKNSTCRFCNKKGHFDSVCRKELAQEKSNDRDSRHTSTNHIVAGEQLYELVGKIGNHHSDPCSVFPKIDGG